MKLAELKLAVYQLAQVSTTQQLKAQYKAIKSLDLRYKVSWEKALAELQSASGRAVPTAVPAAKTGLPTAKLSTGRKKEEKPRKKKNCAKAKKPTGKKLTREKDTKETAPAEFNDWVSNPPSEFGELFAAADTALASFDEKLEKGKQMTKRAIAMTNSLDEFAEATVDEAKRLAKAAQHAIDTSKKADLN